MGKKPTELFVSVVNKSIAACDSIPEQDKKALALAEIAKALALTGLIKPSGDYDNKEATSFVEATPETQEEESPAVWTKKAMKKYAEELKVIEELKRDYDEATINEAVEVWSKGEYSSVDDITPLNIEAFVAYVTELMSDEGEEE